MSSAEPIVLYDILGTSPKHVPYSPNCLRTRYALNYKGLKFRTELVEFVEIEAVCKKLGGAPTTKRGDGSPFYTLPMIYDPATKVVLTDSFKIAQYLDKTYPNTPTLLPPGTLALQAALIDTMWGTCAASLYMNVCPITITCGILTQRDAEYYVASREKMFGRKMEEFGGEEHWKAAEEGFDKIAQWMSKNGPGNDRLVLGMGDEICFADTAIAGTLSWVRAIVGEDSDEWKRIASWNGGKWKKYLEYFDRYATV